MIAPFAKSLVRTALRGETSVGWGPGGGGTLIFTYIHRLVSFFGFKILNFNIFGGFQKNEYFFGV